MMCSALVIWLLSSLMVAWFEFSIFWNLPLLLFAMNLSTFDQLLVVWSLFARILLVTSPGIALIAWSQWNNRGRLSRVIGWSWHFFVLVWLIADVGLQCVTGASLWHYVEKAMVTEDLALGGDVSAITEGVQEALWITGVRIAMLFVVSHFAFRAMSGSKFGRWMKSTMVGLTVTAVVAITGILGARQFVQQQPALEQLYGTIAFPTWFFHPDRIARYGTAAFGCECNEEFADAAAALHQLTKAAATSEPLDDSQKVTASAPHIVVLFTESVRYDAFTKQHTPKLMKWLDRGLVAEQHYTNSNCSELGAFACLYSQFPLNFDDTLDKQVPSSPATRLHQLGYNRQLICSCSVNFARMNEFLGPLNFDRTSLHSPKGNPWHDNDKRTLAEISELVTTASSPQFVFSILMATHYSYDYPPEYDQHPPAGVPALPANPTTAEMLQDRYYKAMAFLDEQFDAFLTSVADSNTIVVITGDHGESFLDDGFLCHGTRLSDIQSRTPLLIIGPGVSERRMNVATSHVDLMPTLLHLATGEEPDLPESHGQSLLNVSSQRDQLLTMAHTNEWDVMLVTQDGRLKVKLPKNSDGLSVMGFYDENARIDVTQKKTAAEIPEWRDRLVQAITPE